jgi:hypothetical protein
MINIAKVKNYIADTFAITNTLKSVLESKPNRDSFDNGQIFALTAELLMLENLWKMLEDGEENG